jgi:hypothetical protein
MNGIGKLLRRRNAEVATNFARKKFVDLSVARDGRGLAIGRIPVDGMAASFPEQFATLVGQMADQLAALLE